MRTLIYPLFLDGIVENKKREISAFFYIPKSRNDNFLKRGVLKYIIKDKKDEYRFFRHEDSLEAKWLYILI